MLRPATPLTILLLAAFVLLLISVLSVPIIKSIPLAQFDGVNFGVFGYCKGDNCKFEVGYNPSASISTEDNFNLPVGARTTLSSILIVHPIAAFFTLVMLVLAAVSHLHAPSHSPRYLLAVFILSILTLILALLSFLIDVLLFVPHMAWGSYIVLAATVLIAASGIVSCAMRRTLVSRKARKRRIEENAEMNGENFYNRQAVAPISPIAAPVASPGPSIDKLPSIATFETDKNEQGRMANGDDERIPLTNRPPSERSPDATMMNLNGRPGDAYGAPVPPPGGQRGYNGAPQRDQYGNIIPPPQTYGGMRNQDPRAQYGPPGGYRGRGGPPPGGYRGRGGPQYGRGGYGAPGYGPGPGGMRGGRGPPPGYSGAYGGAAPMGRGYPNREPSPGAYGYDRSQTSLQSGAGYARSGSVTQPDDSHVAYGGGGRPESLARAESPPPLDEGPVGQAVEMDATTGRGGSGAPQGYAAAPPAGQYGAPLRDSDGDVVGMVGLQQQRQDSRVLSDGSKYSVDEYVPPRQNWAGGNPNSRSNSPGGRASPLHARTNPPPPQPRLLRPASGDNYYEDIDPRFVPPGDAAGLPVPSVLTPGGMQQQPPQQRQPQQQPRQHPQQSHHSYEDLRAGQRSPAESERSGFTSVSQRGVNPRWVGGPPPPMGPGGRRGGGQGQGQGGQGMLLGGNPDFEIGGRRGPAGGVVPRSAYEGV